MPPREPPRPCTFRKETRLDNPREARRVYSEDEQKRIREIQIASAKGATLLTLLNGYTPRELIDAGFSVSAVNAAMIIHLASKKK